MFLVLQPLTAQISNTPRSIAKLKVYAMFVSLTEYKLDVEFPFGRKDWTGDDLDSHLCIASYKKKERMI